MGWTGQNVSDLSSATNLKPLWASVFYSLQGPSCLEGEADSEKQMGTWLRHWGQWPQGGSTKQFMMAVLEDSGGSSGLSHGDNFLTPGVPSTVLCTQEALHKHLLREWLVQGTNDSSLLILQMSKLSPRE